MIQSIIDGIIEKLNATFGDGYEIYTESVKQGLREPCFFIQLVNPLNFSELGKRFIRENLFCIQYFPASEDEPKMECYKVQDELFLALEYIMVDGALQRGVGRRGEFTDGVLSFFVNFNMRVIQTETLMPMGRLDSTDITTKG